MLGEIAELRRSRRLPEILRTTNEPGALADAATAWADASADHKLTVLEAVDLGRAGGARARLGASDHLAELQVNEQIRHDVTEGVDKPAAGVPAAPAARRHPQGARRGRRRRRRTSTGPRRRRCQLPETGARRPSTRRSTGSSARAARAPSRAGSAPGSTASSICRGARTTTDNFDLTGGARRARRRPLRPRRREGPHRRVPRRPQAAPRPRRDQRQRNGRIAVRFAGARGPSSPSSALPAWARPASARASPGPWAASSSASPSAASATRPRSAATAAPTSAPSPGASSGRSPRPAR